MAARKFGARILTPGVYEEVMIGGNNKDSTVNITFVNQGTLPARVSLVYISGTSLTDYDPADHLIFGELVDPNFRKELKGIAVEQNCMLAARVEPANAVVSVLAYGFEEEIS